jgi:hypothetical protein
LKHLLLQLRRALFRCGESVPQKWYEKSEKSYGVGFTLRNATVGKSDVSAEGMLVF